MTKKLKLYLVRFCIKIIAILFLMVFYITDKQGMTEFLTRGIIWKISPLHIIWAFFMIIMILHLFPNDLRSMALLKSKEKKYIPVENYSGFDLLKYVNDQNRKAWIVMLAAFGILFDMRLYMHIVLLSVPLQDNEKQMLCKLPHL